LAGMHWPAFGRANIRPGRPIHGPEMPGPSRPAPSDSLLLLRSRPFMKLCVTIFIGHLAAPAFIMPPATRLP
jgi:hypothetical protein